MDGVGLTRTKYFPRLISSISSKVAKHQRQRGSFWTKTHVEKSKNGEPSAKSKSGVPAALAGLSLDGWNAEEDGDYTPPGHLSEKAAGYWSALVPSRCRSIERVAVLQVALEAMDTADAARAQVAREGLTTKSERWGVVHVHPLVAVET